MRAPRMPVPGESLIGSDFQTGHGGKGANQAIAAKKLGANVTFVSKIGKDLYGIEAKKYLHTFFANEAIIFEDENRATGTAMIIVENSGENMIVVAPAACEGLTASEIDRLEENIRTSSLLVLQYEISEDAIEKSLDIAHKFNVPILLNPAPYKDLTKRMLDGITYITPNETEASLLTDIAVTNIETAHEAAEKLYELGVKNVIITLGSNGCYLYNEKVRGKHYPAFHVNAIDTTGAGDAFNGGFAYALANNEQIDAAITLANATAALSVTKEGTSKAMPTKQEVEALLNTR
jgi:ribokinase